MSALLNFLQGKKSINQHIDLSMEKDDTHWKSKENMADWLGMSYDVNNVWIT